MQNRLLGSTGIPVSPLGLGTVKFGRNQGVKYPEAFELPSDQTILNLIHHAKDLGINLLDTAPAYGNSEERLGKLLSGQRQDWVIVTKAGEEFIDGQSHFDFSKKHLRYSIERSLVRLQTDYLDVVLIHSNGHDQTLIEQEQVFSTLQRAKQQGLIRAYGMSSKTVAGGLLTVDHSDVAMVTYNPCTTNDKVVIQRAYEQQKVF
jgi:aryl-alcohol dehydrogenase-like predicted oxidoreductase